MTLKDAYRKAPTNAAEAAEMLSTVREHTKRGLTGDLVMNTTNARIAFLRGFLAVR